MTTPRPHACRRGSVVVAFVAALVAVRVTEAGFHAGRQPTSGKQAELGAESDQEQRAPALTRHRLRQLAREIRVPIRAERNRWSVEDCLRCVTGPDEGQLFESEFCETRSEQGRAALNFVAKAEDRRGKR